MCRYATRIVQKRRFWCQQTSWIFVFLVMELVECYEIWDLSAKGDGYILVGSFVIPGKPKTVHSSFFLKLSGNLLASVLSARFLKWEKREEIRLLLNQMGSLSCGAPPNVVHTSSWPLKNKSTVT